MYQQRKYLLNLMNFHETFNKIVNKNI